MFKNKVLALLKAGSNQSVELNEKASFCDSCAQVCNEQCQLNSVLTRLDALRTQVRLGTYHF